MAREILFKAKRKNNGKWVYGNYAFNDALGVKRHFIFQNYAYENEVDEKEIIRKTVERVLQRLEENALGGVMSPQWIPIKSAIKIVKEECGINE